LCDADISGPFTCADLARQPAGCRSNLSALLFIPAKSEQGFRVTPWPTKAAARWAGCRCPAAASGL